MSQGAPDPYAILGVSPDASDADVRTAYRRLVLRHHPDHNNGSPESARRFEAVQDAYARVLASRRSAAAPGASGQSRPAVDAEVEARIAAMERELHEARLAQQRARQEAMQAASAAAPRRATPEELGYVTTDDSITKILDDAHRELADRWAASRHEPLKKRLSDLFRGSH